MSDPVMGTLNEPCFMCGAQAGVECQDDCPGLLESDLGGLGREVEFSDLEFPPDPDPPTLNEGVVRIMGAAWRLPFSGLVGDPPDRREMSVDEWSNRMGEWLEGYSAMLRVEIATLSAQARQAIGLQLERDVVRQFFGALALDEQPQEPVEV